MHYVHSDRDFYSFLISHGRLSNDGGANSTSNPEITELVIRNAKDVFVVFPNAVLVSLPIHHRCRQNRNPRQVVPGKIIRSLPRPV